MTFESRNLVGPKGILCIALGAAAAAPGAVVAQMSSLSQNGSPATQQQQQQQQPGAMQPGTMQPGAMNSTQDTGSGTSMTGMAGSQMKDKQFVKKAAQGGLAEIKLGRLAYEKGSTDDVRTFGQKMVTDHTELNSEMKPIADSLGVTVPTDLTAKDQAEYDKLSAMSGTDFDTEYVTYMAKDHHMDLREFRQESMSTQDPALKSTVQKGEKVVAEHTKMVDKMAKDRGIQMPAHSGSAAPSM